MTAKDFVGVVERNSWEGQTFGYYWPWSKDAERHLQSIVGRYHAEGDKSVRLETKTRAELEELDDRDRNGYMPRVNVYLKPESWDVFVAEIAPEDVEVSGQNCHPFYKGRGLPSDQRVRDWREE